jgi:hypothetical protein
MKNTYKILIAFVMIGGFWSCAEDDNFMLAEAQPGEFAIITPSSGTSIIITEATEQDNTGATFTWEDVDYGTPTEVTYALEFAASGTEFATPTTISSATATNYSMTYAALQTVANSLDTTPGVEDAVNIDVRVKSTIGTTGSEPKYSDVITIAVTPFVPVVTEIPKLYVVGGFQNASGYGSDWTPGDAVPLAAASVTSNSYEGYVYFNNDGSEYKFLPTNQSFEGDYGDTGAANGAYSQTLEQSDEVNAGLPSGTAGFYRVKVDLAALTYELAPERWAITGSATALGWPSDDGVTIPDTNMTYDAAAKVWTITLDLTAGGAIKFRANDAWGVNLGGADGVLSYGGADIPIATAGNYTVTLDLSVPREYTYTLTLN